MRPAAIRPRPVHYRGITTRSTLEGRWLIFFDALKIEWEYEPEDFSLPGRGYRPDLWLRTCECWAEIKPAGTPLDHQLTAGIQEETGSPLLWIAGLPQAGAYSVALCDFGGCEVIEGLVFAIGRGGDLWLADEEEESCCPLPPRWMRYLDDFPLRDGAPVLAAYERAMGWRFGGSDS